MKNADDSFLERWGLNQIHWKIAQNRWKWFFSHRSVDEVLTVFLQCEKTYNGTWIKNTRGALLITVEKLAEILGVTRSAITGFEKREADGTITLEKLREIAAAMDCELVYALRPKSRKLFSQIIWEAILPHALENFKKRKGMEQMRGHRLWAAARDIYNDTEFRRSQGWSERTLPVQTSQIPQEEWEVSPKYS